MVRALRSLLGVALVGASLWFAFAVPLGDKTLAEHVDAIGETPEAVELLDGARGTLNPALEEVKGRVLGEHVTAPTRLPLLDDAPEGSVPAPSTELVDRATQGGGTPPVHRTPDPEDEPTGIYARGAGPSTDARPRLPGARGTGR